MIIYRDGASQELGAIYFDNQEHGIDKVIKSSENSAEFLSQGSGDAVALPVDSGQRGTGSAEPEVRNRAAREKFYPYRSQRSPG